MITLASKLREERMRQGKSLEEVAKYTRIKLDFLKLIEKGRYDLLPSQTYVTGFVKNYIQYLGLPVNENMAIFRREFDETMNIKVLPDNYSGNSFTSTFRIHHRLILFVGIILIILLLVGYQFRYFVISPPLWIDTPAQNQVIADNQVVIKGKTDPQVTLSIGDQNVILDKSGRFEKTVRVFEGENSILIVAKHPYGQSREVERIVKVNIDN